jgi:hypothetical protein
MVAGKRPIMANKRTPAGCVSAEEQDCRGGGDGLGAHGALQEPCL